MLKLSKPRRRALRVEPLEHRVVPTADFQVQTLTGNNSAVVEHNAITGADKGGIAVSDTQAFVTGQSATGRFNKSDLSGGTSVGTVYETLTSNLRTGKVYTLGSTPTTPLGFGGGTVNYLLEVGANGALDGVKVALSTPVSITGSTYPSPQAGIFAGYDRVILLSTSGTAYNISLAADATLGQVTTLGTVFPNHNYSKSWAYFGVAEHFGGVDYIDYVVQSFGPPGAPATEVDRMQINAGLSSPIAFFSSLANMASFSVSPSTNRWYFAEEGNSQFATGISPPDDEILGYADATFVLPSIQVTNTNDHGTGSLRQALADADTNPGFDVITFAPGVFGTITLNTGNLTVGESVQIVGPGSSIVTVQGDAADQIFVPSNGNTIDLTLSGLTLDNAAGQAFGTDIISDGDLVVDAHPGHISFSKSLAVQSGTTTLFDNNAISLGPLTTVDGTLKAANGFALGNGETLTGNGAVTGAVAVGGTLAGNLTVGGDVTVQSGGTISPGSSPGIITINGNLQILNGGTLTIELDGTGANQFDHLFVNGTVDLGTGTNLVATLGYAANPGDDFDLIANDGTDAVAGLINGIRNRAGINIGGTLFQVRIDGGDGNDVELVCNNSPVLNTQVTSTLTDILEDTPHGNISGTSVQELIDTPTLYDDANGRLRSGIAVTSVDSTHGVWQFSTDSGNDWTTFPTVSDTSATLLEADALSNTSMIRFVPDQYFYGTAAISYRAWDVTDNRFSGATGVDVSSGGGNSAFSAETVASIQHVLAVNHNPTAGNVTATLMEDAGAQSIDVLSSCSSFPDVGETLTIVAVTQGQHGTVAITNGGTLLTYNPAPNYAGPDSFLYTIADGNGGYAAGAVTVSVTNDAADRLEVVTTPGTDQWTETVSGIGQQAVPVDSGIRIGTALEGVLSSATVRFTSGFVAKKDTLFYPPNKSLPNIKASFNAKTGVLTLTGVDTPADYQTALRTVLYTNPSAAPVDGIRTVSFQVSDAAGTGDPASKLVQVTGVDSAPVLKMKAPALTYKKRGKPLAVASSLAIGDIDNTRLQSATVTITLGLDPLDQLAVTIKKNAGITANYANGMLTLTGNATLAAYLSVLKTLSFTTPSGAAAGARTISITVNDGVLDSTALTRTVNVM
jgi:hypothetical protein